MTKAESERIINSLARSKKTNFDYELRHYYGRIYPCNPSPAINMNLAGATNTYLRDNDNLDALFIIATTFYGSKTENTDTPLQNILRGIYFNEKTSESMKRSIRALLTTRTIKSTQFVNALRKIIDANHIVGFNYVSLLCDLANWSKYKIYNNWTETILINKEN